MIVLERSTSFTSIFNFRDLGGYPTAEGRTVVWRRLFRSDDLGRLTAQDADRFADLGIRTVIDLRRPTEVAELGRIPEFTGVDYRHVHLVHQPWQPAEFAGVGDRVAYLTARYLDMSAESGEGIGTALRLIAESHAAPLVIHCIAGKDRTGIISGITLSLLGVDDDMIAADYALSEASEAAVRAHQGREPSRIAITPPQVMRGFFAGLRDAHGSVEAYVKSVGVTADHIAAMRAHLLT
jgi:protein-tyrosine phosphatase